MNTEFSNITSPYHDTFTLFDGLSIYTAPYIVDIDKESLLARAVILLVICEIKEYYEGRRV